MADANAVEVGALRLALHEWAKLCGRRYKLSTSRLILLDNCHDKLVVKFKHGDPDGL